VRVEQYEPRNRTFVLVVEVEKAAMLPGGGGAFPITEGMFCEVRITGRRLDNIVEVPRVAVDSAGRVLVSEDGRLRSRAIEVARYQGDVALVSRGLRNGDLVITSRPPEFIDGVAVNLDLRPLREARATEQ
jgi:multidrug efflux pump subunit AcrA (membrane-fusion protein)